MQDAERLVGSRFDVERLTAAHRCRVFCLSFSIKEGALAAGSLNSCLAVWIYSAQVSSVCSPFTHHVVENYHALLELTDEVSAARA
jgi:hypothetical protein